MHMNVCVALQGKALPLLSSFKLSYYTILNMLRQLEGGEARMEHIIRSSFQQFQQERKVPEVGAPPAGFF